MKRAWLIAAVVVLAVSAFGEERTGILHRDVATAPAVRTAAPAGAVTAGRPIAVVPNFCDASECGSLPADGSSTGGYGDSGNITCKRATCYECAWVPTLGSDFCVEKARAAFCSCSDTGLSCSAKGSCTIG